MSDGKSTCLWTAGIGCGLLLILIIVGGVLGFYFVRNTFSGFEGAVQSRQDLENQFGRVDEYSPADAGVIAPDRLRTFLQVRQETSERRQALASFFGRIPDSEKADQLRDAPIWERLTFGLSMARGGIGLAGDIGHFFEERNRSLLAQGMGMGEYSYIYCTVYYGWLRKNPMDGPGTGNSQVSVRGFTTERIRHNWISALERAAEESDQAEESELTALLREEVEKLREDSHRIPWQDAFPEALSRPLEPFRTELESVYIPVTNPFELVVNVRQGQFGYSSE